MITIIPGIFEQTPEEIERKVALVSPYCGWIQIDIADGTFVSAKTPIRFPFLKKFSNSFEAHLMVESPEILVKSLMEAGFRRLIGHVECASPREFLAEARAFDCEVGLALDLDTPLEEIEPFLEELDTVLVMAIVAGASGQMFEERSLSKIKAIHRNLPDLPVAVDGGMNDETIKPVVEAGATRIISTSYIFRDESKIQDTVSRLSSVLETP